MIVVSTFSTAVLTEIMLVISSFTLWYPWECAQRTIAIFQIRIGKATVWEEVTLNPREILKWSQGTKPTLCKSFAGEKSC